MPDLEDISFWGFIGTAVFLATASTLAFLGVM